jgi:ABC-type phosphate/phosphonate transport system substrate-binding protein
VVDQPVLEAYGRRKPGRFEQLKVVARSPPFPPTVIAYDDRFLDERTRRRVQAGLLGATRDEKQDMVLSLFRWKGFVSVPDDFQEVLVKTRQAYLPPQSNPR